MKIFFFSNTIDDYTINNENKIFIIEEFDFNAIDILSDRNINYKNEKEKKNYETRTIKNERDIKLN